MFLPVFHIYGFLFFYKLLCEGVTIVSVPKFDPVQFFRAVEKYKSPQLYLVPPVMVLMAKSPIMDKFDLSCVHSIFAGAAPIGYGMSEDGISNAQSLAGNPPGIYMKQGSVGPLTPNYEAKVIDPSTKIELGPDKVGELYIRAPAMMLGYFEKQEATDATIDSEGWLHTGDLSYYDKDGNFYIVERLKELIKVSGFQVAPAELEDLLLSHPKVAEAAVVAVPHLEKGEVPRAYIVPRPEVSKAEIGKLAQELTEFVEKKAVHYKRLLGGVILVESIPKLPSGKILRRILREQIAKEFAEKNVGKTKAKM